MGIRKEINDMIIERGGTPPVNGGIAASIDALSKLLSVGGGSVGGGFNPTIVTLDMATMNLSLSPAEIQAKKEAGETVFFSFMGELMPIAMGRDSSGAIISAMAVGNPSPYDENKMQMSTISFDADGSFVAQNMYSWAVTKEV